MVYDALATYASKQENTIDITETLNLAILHKCLKAAAMWLKHRVQTLLNIQRVSLAVEQFLGDL